MKSIAIVLCVVAASCGPSTNAPVRDKSMSHPMDYDPPAARMPEPPVDAKPTVRTDTELARDKAREPLATEVVDAYSNWDGFFSSVVATWTPDGKHIIYGSMRDGFPELYLGDVAKPAERPVALTVGPDRATSALLTPDGKSLLFKRDDKGDENHAIWKVSLAGGDPVNLTPGEKLQRGDPTIPAKLPSTMFYDARGVADLGVKIYAQPVAGGDAKVVWEQKEPGGLGDVSPDGKQIIVGTFRRDGDQVMSVVDLASGKVRRLAPPEGKIAGSFGIAYMPDGKRALYSTEEGDTVVLEMLDVATGKELARYTDSKLPHGPMSFAPAGRGDVIAVLVDGGNHGEVRLVDGKTLKLVKSFEVPLGDVLLGSWRPDGKAFSIMVSKPDQPADVFAVDAKSGAVTPLRADARPELAKLPPIESSIAEVKAFDGLTIPVNVYLPPHADGKKLPSIVIFHGGPATSYAVRWNPYARFFVSLGYAVLEPNVRGSSGFGRAFQDADNREKRADWLKDLETVNAWVKGQAWADQDRVVVWGQSYGGYTTLMALTRQAALWRAGVDLYGPADLKAFLLSTDALIRMAFVAEFGDVDKDAALLEQFSPMRDVDKITRPLFVYAGANDPRVPLSEDDAIVLALRQRKVPVEYMVARDEGHTADKRTTKIELLTRTARFLEDALK